MKRLFKSKKAGCVGWKIMTLLLALLFAGFITSCSSDEDETIPSEEKVLTKHITMNVNSDSIRTTRVGNQSRFEVDLPENGHGYLSYSFQIGDTLHALTKINGKYHDSPLICTKVDYDNLSQSATFEGDIQYSEANKTVYLFLGHYLALRNNLLYLGERYKIFNFNNDSNNPPINFNQITNAPWLYLYGRTHIEDSSSTLSASLDMLTSFITVTVPQNIINELDYYGVGVFLASKKNDQYKVGFPDGDIFFNIETAKIEATSYNTEFSFSADKNSLIQSDGTMNIPLLPGNYKVCTCMVDYGEREWQSNSATFSTVVGKDEGSYYKIQTQYGIWSFPQYSSNRNFFFGTVGEIEHGKTTDAPSPGSSVDFSKPNN